MKRNVVFMFNVTIKNSKLDGDRWLSNRSDPYVYSVKSWQQWCEKNDFDFYVLVPISRDIKFCSFFD